ncbi:MAG: beta-propeller fold lactonase family protein [Candidatus Cybelea sp.]
MANYDDNDVSAHKINATSGALAPVKGSPFGAGSGACTVTVDPTGKFAYVINLGSGDIFAYTINATSGALKPVAGSPFKAGSFPDGVATCRRIGSACRPPPS